MLLYTLQTLTNGEETRVSVQIFSGRLNSPLQSEHRPCGEDHRRFTRGYTNTQSGHLEILAFLFLPVIG